MKLNLWYVGIAIFSALFVVYAMWLISLCLGGFTWFSSTETNTVNELPIQRIETTQTIQQPIVNDYQTTIEKTVELKLPSELSGECLTINGDLSYVVCNGKRYNIQ